MIYAVKQLCALSVLCGIMLDLAPAGRVRQVMNIACTCVLIYALLSPIAKIDMFDYALELAHYREESTALTTQAEEIQTRLNRTVIEQECETYILDKAEELGMGGIQVDVRADWDPSGVWVPVEISIVSNCNDQQNKRLSEIIQAELGVGQNKQSWGGEQNGYS